MKEGKKIEYPKKIPDDELLKMPHTKAWKSKPQPRLEPALSHWWQARKADMQLHHSSVLMIAMVVLMVMIMTAMQALWKVLTGGSLLLIDQIFTKMIKSGW